MMRAHTPLKAWLTSLVRAVRSVGANHFGIGLHRWAEESEPVVRSYWESRNLPRYAALADRVANLRPRTVLEVGAGCGALLAVLAARLPEARLVGVDISALAVRLGTEWLREEGLTNVELRAGCAEQLAALDLGRFDVVVTSATLIYVRPRDIEAVLRALLERAQRGIALMEMHAETLRFPRGELFGPGNWKRDYRRLLVSAGVKRDRIACEPVPEPLWTPGGGDGTFIQVQLED